VQFIVDLPIKIGDFHSSLYVYQYDFAPCLPDAENKTKPVAIIGLRSQCLIASPDHPCYMRMGQMDYNWDVNLPNLLLFFGISL
jgi:hypothetical protein